MSDVILLTATGLGLAGLYFLVASGLSLIYGLMGVLNFAHGAFLTFGAYGAYVVMQKLLERDWGLNQALLVGLVASMLAGGLIAWFTEAALIRRLYARHIDQVLVTVGLGLAVGAAIAGYAGQDARFLFTPPWMDNVLEIGEARIPYDRFILIGAGVLLFVALQLIMQKTRLGLIIRAGVENRAMVTALGIDVRIAFTAVFVIGGVAAGLAGALTGVYYRQVSPAMGAGLLLFAFIVVVIGGMGSLAGTAVASILVGLIQQFTNYYATGIGDLAVVLLLAIVLLTRPQGLLGKAAV
jgi:branched-chain amino acid transport system permease protein